MADISVRHFLGQTPSNMEIIGGVLSSNANDSHLIAETKSPEQLKSEKEQMLANIKAKVLNGEMSLGEASNLIHDVNIAFSSYDESTTVNKNGMHR